MQIRHRAPHLARLSRQSQTKVDAASPVMEHVTVITHPLVQHNLTRLRDKRTGPQEFRRVLSEVAALTLKEETGSVAVQPSAVHTPREKTRGLQLRREVVLVPSLRGGWGMLRS